jgi:Flp pilus assembly protein TadG
MSGVAADAASTVEFAAAATLLLILLLAMLVVSHIRQSHSEY